MTDKRYRNVLLLVLLLVLAFNYVDRLALGLVLQDIKAELDLTDTQLGFLSGLAFALFYSLMGVPIARWADRGNRVTIISLTTFLWSIAVALCGLVGSFAQLLLVRVGVAIGEAGCVPPAHSLIADYFTRAERPRAVSLYMLGSPLSMLIGYLLAGWLNEIYGWRVTFVAIGVPGLALAVIAWLILKEPRKSRPVIQDDLSVTPDLFDVVRTLFANKAFRHLAICFSVIAFFGFGIQQWQPTFFIRSYGVTTGELGTWLTVIYGLGALIGLSVGGAWAVRHAGGNERLQLSVAAVSYVLFAVIAACIYLVSNRYVAFALTAISAIGASAITGPMFATIQSLVPERMRATSIAIIYLCANLIGMGLGPLAAGALSDAFAPAFGAESLRYALLALSPGYLWAAWHLWRASRTVMADLARTT